MTKTPWGDSEGLRERKLRPSQGSSRDDVERSQRERLYGATVAVVADKGYARSTITDLIEMAGVSRTTFYRLFADKEACFLETLSLILQGISLLTRTGLDEGGSARERAEGAMGTFVGMLAAQSDAARICVVEAEVAGPRAVGMVDATAAEFGRMLTDVFDRFPGQRGMPKPIVDAMIGGLRKLLQTRLHRHTEAELTTLVPALVDLALSYPRPPGRLPDRASRRKAAPTAGRYGGIDEPSERLELAAMGVVAEEGYADARMAAIAARARVSLGTLYANFDNKEDLLRAALLRSRLRMAAAVTPCYLRADSWAEGIATMIPVVLAFFEAEPDFARLITVDIYSAGDSALEGRDRALESVRHFIESGLHYPDQTRPIAAEMIQSALYSMLSARIRSRHKNLQGMAPLAIYLVLAPSLGAEKAYSYATR